MSKKDRQAVMENETRAIQLEQALCNSALGTSEYDTLSDDEWVELCEKIAREATCSSRRSRSKH
jgi:hypothetical protein